MLWALKGWEQLGYNSFRLCCRHVTKAKQWYCSERRTLSSTLVVVRYQSCGRGRWQKALKGRFVERRSCPRVFERFARWFCLRSLMGIDSEIKSLGVKVIHSSLVLWFCSHFVLSGYALCVTFRVSVLLKVPKRMWHSIYWCIMVKIRTMSDTEVGICAPAPINLTFIRIAQLPRSSV